MNNILKMLKQAKPEHITAGKVWYSQAYNYARYIADTCGGSSFAHASVLQAAGVIAALSPNNKWDRNILDAIGLTSAFLAGNPLPKVCTFGRNKEKALAILNADSDSIDTICAILSGQKVKDFFLSILNLGGVCVDGHAFAIWQGKRTPASNVGTITPKQYKAIREDYIAASKFSLWITGQHLTPSEVQAVTWVTYRNLHNIG